MQVQEMTIEEKLGKAEFTNWETAKKQIAERISSTNVYDWVDWNRALT